MLLRSVVRQCFNKPDVPYPIVQFPSRNLWTRQVPLDLSDVTSQTSLNLVQTLRNARSFYRFPSLSAPQLGWNARVFVLFNGKVYFNPTAEVIDPERKAWAWEPCASCNSTICFIERPVRVRVTAWDECGHKFEEVLGGIAGRMAQHEMDHLDGVLFMRRVPDTDHIVPMEGLSCFSDWEDDFPSIEARSTPVYTLLSRREQSLTGEWRLESEYIPDGDFLKRRMEDQVYPGWEVDKALMDGSEAMRGMSAAFVQSQREQ